MTGERFRLDLDGVELKDVRDGSGRVLCILRWRTVKGLVLRLPESVDVLVPWRLVEAAQLDLSAGVVRIAFTPGAKEELSWLQGVTELRGEWTDRELLAAPP